MIKLSALFAGIRSFFAELFSIIQMVVVAALVVFFTLCLCALIITPLAPIITVLVVLGFTVHAFKLRWTAVLAVLGIAFYALSWPTAHMYGAYPGVLVCVTGILTWFTGVYMSFGRQSDLNTVTE